MSDGPRRLPDVQRGSRVNFVCDGEAIAAFEGETIGAALLAAGRRTLRHTTRNSEPRGLFCAMGACFECLVTVDGRSGVRACMTPVRNGVRVETR